MSYLGNKNSPDSGGLDDWTEVLCKVHTRALSEASNHPTRLVALQSPVGVELVLEDPLAGDDIGSQRARHKIQVWFFIRASCSSTIAARQLASARALW